MGSITANAENVKNFNNFGVEHISKEIRKFIGKNIYRHKKYLQNTSTMCVFIDFVLKCKSLLEYTNLFSPNGYENKKTK